MFRWCNGCYRCVRCGVVLCYDGLIGVFVFESQIQMHSCDADIYGLNG